MAKDRRTDRHRAPRLPPLTIEQQYLDKLTAIAEHVGLPMAWVARKLLIEALDEVDIESLPKNLMRPGKRE